MAADPWAVLGVAPTDDPVAVRRAYARALKTIDPEADPAAFISLREARDRAMEAAEAGAPALERAVPEPAVSEPDDAPAPAPAGTGAAGPLPPASEPDLDALRTLHAMVLDPAGNADPGAVAAQAERVLSDPAMLNLDHAARAEAFLADLIVQGSPHSDPVIEPAAAHFRWDAPEAELGRPPAVAWALKRREDRYFEMGLPQTSRGYARLLDRLRRPPPRRWGGFVAWRLGTRVEYFLSYLQALHPTVLAGLDREGLAWWTGRIGRQRRAPGPLRWLREWDRRLHWSSTLGSYNARTGLLGVLAFFALVAWAGGLSRHSVERVDPSFGAPGPAGDRADGPFFPEYTVTAPRRLTSLDPDMDTALARFAGAALDAGTVRARNPALYRRLAEAWTAATAGQRETGAGGADAFDRAVGRELDRVFGAALGQGDDPFVTDHARFFESRLRWAERGSPGACADALAGRGEMDEDFRAYRAKLVSRAVLSGAEPRGGAEASKTFRVPAALFDDAVKRSGLPRAEFRRAVGNKGTATARCNAAIALVDAALVSPEPNGLKLLRSMFGGAR